MKKMSLLTLLAVFAISLYAQEKIPIPTKPASFSLSDYEGTVKTLNDVNAKGYINYASYLQAAISYDHLKQPENEILSFYKKALEINEEKTCETILFMEEKKWMLPEHFSREKFEKLIEQCYCNN